MRINKIELHTSIILDLIFFVTNCLIAAGFALKGTPSQIANPAVTSSFFILLLLLEKYTSFRMNTFLRILVIITLISHSFFGEYLRAYYTTAYFDNLLHFFGSFTFALLSYEIFCVFIKVQTSDHVLFRFLIISLFGITLGTLFELIEFALDQMLHEKNQFGLVDTDLDMVFNGVGALFAGMFTIIKDFFVHRLR